MAKLKLNISEKTTPGNLAKNNTIQGLRAFAVISVLMFHAFPEKVSYGYLGVDVFFVISGYLITNIIIVEYKQTNKINLRRFFIKRFLRIYPNLIIVIMVFYILGFLYFSPNTLISFAESAISSIFGFGNIYFSEKTYYFDNNSASQPLLNLWSLGVELQFYLLWSITLATALILRSNIQVLVRNIIFLNIIFIYLPSFFTVQQEFYLLPFRTLQFASGAYIAILLSKAKPKKSRFLFSQTINIFFIFLAIIVCLDFSSLNSTKTFITTLVTSLIILNSEKLKDKSIYFSLLDNPIMHHIGNLSYSMYLIHWPLLYYLKMIVPDVNFMNFGLNSQFNSIILYFALTYLGAIFIFYFVEKSVLRKNLKLWIGMFLVLLLISFCAVFSDGFPTRFNANLIKNLELHYGPENFGNIYGECWLPNQTNLIFSKNCHSPSNLAIIWGDSGSASLAAALKNNYDQGLTMFSKDGCPPKFIVDPQLLDGESCAVSNFEISQIIKKSNIKLVILNAQWEMYSKSDSNILQELNHSIKEMNNIGLQVYVIGSSPTWSRNLPDIIIEKGDKVGFSATKLYQPINDSSLKNSFIFESEFRNSLSNVLSTEKYYFSIVNLFCNNNGCNSFVPNSNYSLVTYDSFHLSPAAATYVVESFEKQIS